MSVILRTGTPPADAGRISETDYMWLFVAAVPVQLGPCWHIERRTIVRGAVIQRTGARVSAGIPGQADLFAIAPGNQHIELETKSLRGALREAQKKWRARCDELGVPYLVLRPLFHETPEQTISRWCDLTRAAHRR